MDLQKLLSADYLDILFEGRNKSYGGYELRRTYASRTRKATAAVIISALVIAAIPVIAGRLSTDNRNPALPIDKPNFLREIPVYVPPKQPVLPPPEQAATVSTYKSPILRIVEDVDVPEPPKAAEDRPDQVPGLTDNPGTPDGIDPGLKIPEGNGTAQVDIPAKKAEGPALVVEQMPAFNGDLAAYLRDHLRYPEVEREREAEGRVGIRFVVNEDGSISDVDVFRSASALLDAEAVRVVSGMPRWKPGKQGGIPVKVYFTLPITFQLD